MNQIICEDFSVKMSTRGYHALQNYLKGPFNMEYDSNPVVRICSVSYDAELDIYYISLGRHSVFSHSQWIPIVERVRKESENYRI